MEPTKYVLEVVMAIAATFAMKGVDMTIEKTKELIQEMCKKNPALSGQIDIDELAKKIQESAGHVGRVAYNEETLSRFLEIPVPDLPTLNPNNIEMDVLFNHVRLEREFHEWLEEWGYDIDLGCVLAGLRGVEYMPDVYGILNTLHGKFEVCVNFACDNPPDEDRVFALLGKIEAYSEAKKSFSYGDIFAIVTPHRFTQAALNAMGLQNEQENYSVISLDGPDVDIFEKTDNPRIRLDQFQDKVRQAEEESRRARIKRSAQEQDDEVR